METYRKDTLIIKKFPSRKLMGETAAADAAAAVRELLKSKSQIRMIFAAAPSQNEFLEAFGSDRTVDFGKITAFHMDEYAGLPADAPQGFGNFLRERLFQKCPFKEVHYINGLAKNINDECERYSKLLNHAPVDIVCMGIGENAHIAFNDPPADFDRDEPFKIVKLDEACRKQQLGEGWFRTLEDVPETAITMTPKQIMKCEKIISVVPYKVKAKAVHDTLTSESVTNIIPATILKTHPDWTLYLDNDSASMIEVNKYN